MIKMQIKDSAKTILCYGDSNTWGRVPPHGVRYPRSVRWTGVLQNLMGDEYEIISEGLIGRTLVAGNPKKPGRTGITHLKAILESHKPIDLVIVMLGTNDATNIYNLTAQKISGHLEETINLIKEEKVDTILIVCPPDIISENDDMDPKYLDSSEIMKKLPELFKKVAEKYKCNFVNAQDYISSSKLDGVHFDASEHRKLAEVLKIEILKILI